MTSFVNNIFECIATMANHLIHYNQKEMQNAVQLLLFGELAKHSVMV